MVAPVTPVASNVRATEPVFNKLIVSTAVIEPVVKPVKFELSVALKVSAPTPPSIASVAFNVAAEVSAEDVPEKVSSLAVPVKSAIASTPVVSTKAEPGLFEAGIAAVIAVVATVTVDATLVTPVRKA